MFSLIITLISISLTAATLYTGINYINYDIYDQMMTESSLSSDFYNYNTAFLAYKKTFNVYPSTSDWESELIKMKILLPDNSKGIYSYLHDVSNFKVGICRQETISKNNFKAVKDFQDKDLTILASSCFRDNNEIIDESNNEVSYALTMWIQN